MTIGPEPMMRILRRSWRLGIARHRVGLRGRRTATCVVAACGGAADSSIGGRGATRLSASWGRATFGPVAGVAGRTPSSPARRGEGPVMEPSDQETTRGPIHRHGGPRRPEEKPFLVGIAGEHAGRLFPLEGLREVFVGRSADCEIHCYLDELVSRRHVQIEFDETGRAWLNDLESLNGTLVNGHEVVRPMLLRRGDRIYVGDSNILKIDYLTDDEVTRWQSAAVDALTECFNRAMLDSRAPEIFERARARERPFAVIIVDVDRF